jgi:hypothetical protein
LFFIIYIALHFQTIVYEKNQPELAHFILVKLVDYILALTSIKKYLSSGQIEQVLCDGENYGGARPCHYEWVKSLRDECMEKNVTFVFCGTGRRFVKDGRLYKLKGSIQSEQAYKSGLSFQGKRFTLNLQMMGDIPSEKTNYISLISVNAVKTVG